MFGIPGETSNSSLKKEQIATKSSVPWKERSQMATAVSVLNADRLNQEALPVDIEKTLIFRRQFSNFAQGIKIKATDGIVPRACAEVLAAIEVYFNLYSRQKNSLDYSLCHFRYHLRIY